MKRFILTTILLSIFIFSCEDNKYRIDTEIDAKIIGTINNCIGIHYELAGITILEDLCDLKVSQLSYIRQSAKDDVVTLRLVVKATDQIDQSGSVSFDYYIGTENIGSGKNVVKMFILAEHAHNIPGFEWILRDNMTPEEYENTKKETELEVTLKSIEEPVSETKNKIPSLKLKVN